MKSKPYELYHQLGSHFQSKLLTVEPADFEFKHLDYFPMLNNRVHSVGDDDTKIIMNKNFRLLYEKFLQVMSEKKQLTEVDKLVFVYYLHLQDRNQLAIKLFKTI